MGQCTARSKRTGERCKRFCSEGKKVCRIHGGASNGAPKGSKNALKHGAYEKITRDTMFEEELSYIKDVSTDPVSILEEQLRILKVKELRIGKPGLNKSILDQGWFEFRRQRAYKLAWLGGTLLAIPSQYSSQTCSRCGCVDKKNRPSQARFTCTACGFECNADYNAALNILAAGHAVSACGAGRAQAPALKQEPAYGTAR